MKPNQELTEVAEVVVVTAVVVVAEVGVATAAAAEIVTTIASNANLVGKKNSDE